MKIRELLKEDIKLSATSNKAKAWIEKVYAKYPTMWQNNHVMLWGQGDDQQMAMFELVPSFSKKDAVEVKWFQAYPMRQGVGSRAMKELQALAREDGIILTLYPWDKGQVSQSKLTKFYKGQGFEPAVKGSKSLAWSPDGVTEDPMQENFDDGKNPGRKGLAKRSGVDCKQSVTKLRSIASNSSGERQRMAHWCANMKSGRKKTNEGGWDTTITQGTIIKPAVVKVALGIVQQFVTDFNRYLQTKKLGPVQMGLPTGSSAYFEKDQQENPDKVYGDIDLQMIAPSVPNATYGQYTTFWNKLADEFVNTIQPDYVHPGESKIGHPIIQIGDDAYVQVDFMWHEEKMRNWGATRVTPEHGVKGLLTGNMYSVFGELLDMSIQHAGVQLKVVDGQRVPFSKQKDTEVVTVSISPKTFILDTFRYLASRQGIDNPSIDPLLKQFSGNDIADVKISKLVNGVKGFAASAEANDMFGQGDLVNFSSAQDFINKFWSRYEEKAMIDIAGKKRDKATTPDAIARANADREKITQGLNMVKDLFK